MEIKFERKEVEKILEEKVFEMFVLDPKAYDIESTESYGDFKITVTLKEKLEETEVAE